MMVVRRKAKRRRGERTYHGMHKNWRGGGNRGGRGKAGRHKHKWSYVVKYEPDYFGKRGFKPPERKALRTINLKELDKMIKEGIIKGDKVNLSELGYDKLLGTGKINYPLVVEVKKASVKAIEKIEKVGGKVIQV